MPYSALAHRLLVSAPSDVPDDDIAAVTKTINRWNVIYGQRAGAVVVPMDWKAHSAAEHGVRPQESLNAQLVEQADIVIALFWHRLGSPTGEAESGTLEEIDKAQARGAYVAILRCTRDVPRQADPQQLQKLNEFYEEVESRSYMLDYDEEADLARHVDTILNRAETRSGTRAQVTAEAEPAGAQVWPRVERTEIQETDSGGRLRTKSRWRLVLSNTGRQVARDVEYRLEPERPEDHLPQILESGSQREIEALAPGGEAPYTMSVHSGVADQVRCVVTWEDDDGKHENAATLRLF